ncbi:MAG: hypothetical protein WC375_12935 [Methanomassiliicoccales archaeon]|jgi:hypothetical protein
MELFDDIYRATTNLECVLAKARRRVKHLNTVVGQLGVKGRRREADDEHRKKMAIIEMFEKHLKRLSEDVELLEDSYCALIKDKKGNAAEISRLQKELREKICSREDETTEILSNFITSNKELDTATRQQPVGKKITSVRA